MLTFMPCIDSCKHLIFHPHTLMQWSQLIWTEMLKFEKFRARLIIEGEDSLWKILKVNTQGWDFTGFAH